MFKRQGDKYVCIIHPDVERQRKPAKLKKSIRLVDCCPECDKLVEELKRTKVTSERYGRTDGKKDD